MCLGSQRREVVARLWLDVVRLVGDGPQHDTRMVLVALHELPHRLQVRAKCALTHGVGRERGHLPAGAEDTSRDVQVQADGRRLVDDHHTLSVRVVQHLLGVGVVRGAERVRAGPVQQGEVMHHQGVVVRPAAHGGVLVFAEALEVEGDSVDQEFLAPYLHRAHAHGLPVTVDEVAGGAPHRGLEFVQVAVPGRPGVHVGDPEGPHRSGGGLDLGPGGVAQRDTYDVLFGLCGAVHAIGHEAGRVLQAGGHGDVGDVDKGRGVEPHGPVQSRVVEEVVEVALHPAAVLAFLHSAGGIDSQVSSLLTTTVTRFSAPGRRCAVTSASKGV